MVNVRQLKGEGGKLMAMAVHYKYIYTSNKLISGENVGGERKKWFQKNLSNY